MTRIKRFLPILVFTMTAFMFTSCDKKDEIVQALTESDAVEIIETAMQSNSGGLTTNLEDMSDQLMTAVSTGLLCDSIYMNTISKDHQGIQIQAEYTSDCTHEMTCNNLNVPQTASATILTTSAYSSPRIQSDDNSTFAAQATGLQPSSLLLNISGYFNQEGTQDINLMGQKSVSSTLIIDLDFIEVNKQNYHINAGSSTFSLTGTTSNDSFSFVGDLVFNGDNSATVTINGTAYVIDWN